MRKTALSWLVEVACEYHFHQDTLFLAASLLDRFLSCTKVLTDADPGAHPDPGLHLHHSTCWQHACNDSEQFAGQHSHSAGLQQKNAAVHSDPEPVMHTSGVAW